MHDGGLSLNKVVMKMTLKDELRDLNAECGFASQPAWDHLLSA